MNASARAISSTEIEPAIGLPTYGGFVQLLSESPKPATPLTQADPPDLSNGPHFFYALQWWFFGILAALRRAQQPAKKRPPPTDSERAHHTAVDGQHGAGDERRGRAEQERRGTAEL